MTIGTMTLTAGTAREVRTARQALMAQLERWGCGRVPDALLVFSELATNAVMHAGGATNILVVHGDQFLRFEVHDDTHEIPHLLDITGPNGGFGLRIVDQLSEDWGWSQTPTGKYVWSAVACCPISSRRSAACDR
jgi:anti-sigma regulatory factor (Ser/Thr protein kinase)